MNFKPPTLNDVAERAGVSLSTVSRVVENSDRVAAKTRNKVLGAMEELGYYGNAAARQLASGASSTIGVITSSTTHFGYSRTIEGIEAAARVSGKSTQIAVIDHVEQETVRDSVALVVSQNPGGVLVLDYDEPGHAALQLLPKHLPVVAVSSKGYASPEVDYACIDDVDGGYVLAQHLLELGHRSIFIVAPRTELGGHTRRIGVERALLEARLPQYPITFCDSWAPADGYAAGRELLEDYGDRVTAVVCANDELAVGVMRAVTEAGLRIPEDVSVAGFDDHDVAGYLQTSLTTVRQDFVELGKEACGMLLKRIVDGPAEVRQVVLDSVLKVRESTGAVNAARGL